MSARLNEFQLGTLRRLAHDGQRSAWPTLRLGTLDALERRGLVQKITPHVGAMMMPRTAIKWRITTAGIFTLEKDYDPTHGAAERKGEKL